MIKNRLASVSALTMTLVAASVQAATYDVVELQANGKGIHGFAQSVNERGDALMFVQTPFKPDIDVDLLDVTDNPTLTDNLSDVDAVKAGNISTADLTAIYNHLRQRNADSLSQKIELYNSYEVNDSNVTVAPGFDVPVAAFDNRLSGSVNTYAFDINDQGVIVGSGIGPTRKVAYTDKDSKDVTYVVRDFWFRGFANVNGVNIPLVPRESRIGGLSEAKAINNSNQIAGSQSIGFAENTLTRINNCNDDDKRADIPVDLCMHLEGRTAGLSNIRTDATANIRSFTPVQFRATVWQLGDDNQLSVVKEFGLADTPEGGHESSFFSRATGINNQGVAVGEASDYFRDLRNSNAIRTFAAIFKDDKVTLFTDQQEYRNSTATDINDSNLVIGHATKSINGFLRNKFFVHDINSGETKYPKDFFPGSSSTARDINNQGWVVGDGEVDSNLSQTRRRHAFLYNTEDESFKDLNTFLTCNSKYTIVQGNSIKDKGEILATAVVTKPRLNIAGEVVKNDAGVELTQDVTIAVKLVPNGGSVDDCTAQKPKVKRKGGSVPVWIALLLLPLAAWRRKGL